MTPGERWLATLWPLVRASLPTPPARVVDIGCGPLGGFVPMLRADDYDAVGIDPQAPEEPHYQRIDFERAELRPQVDAAVASTSLHHVSDPVRVIDRIIRMLASGGTVVVVEKFDQQTAEWCFERLGPDDEAGWLHRRRDEWLASGHDWSTYLRDWAKREGLHRGDELVRLLDARLDRHLFTDGPYFFPDLADTTEADEQAAIEAGQMQPNRLYYVGTRR